MLNLHYEKKLIMQKLITIKRILLWEIIILLLEKNMINV